MAVIIPLQLPQNTHVKDQGLHNYQHTSSYGKIKYLNIAFIIQRLEPLLIHSNPVHSLCTRDDGQ